MTTPRKIHKSITISRVSNAVELEMTSLENPGFCLACGEDAYDVEPDARDYECEFCECDTVFGASEVLLMGAYHADGPDNPVVE